MLKISLFLNNKFLTNGALLAENLYYQKKYQQSLEVYEELKLIDNEIKKLIIEAAEFAQQSSEPDPSELWTDVYREVER